MKKIGVLNDRLSGVIARMGHMDLLTICDAGLPIPNAVERIDLAVVPGVPSFLQVLRAVIMELQVQKIFLAVEIKDSNLEIEKAILALFPNVDVEYIPHQAFKRETANSCAIIRTGECTPYANIILESGVFF